MARKSSPERNPVTESSQDDEKVKEDTAEDTAAPRQPPAEDVEKHGPSSYFSDQRYKHEPSSDLIN